MACGCTTNCDTCPDITTAQIGELEFITGLRTVTNCKGYFAAADLLCYLTGLATPRAAAVAVGETVLVKTATGCAFAPLPSAAAETPFTGVAGNGIVLTAGGVSGHSPTIASQVSADAGNAVVFGADGGLFVPAATALFDDQVLAAVNSSSLTITLTPSAPIGTDNQVNYSMTGNVNISPTAGNILTDAGNGMMVACEAVQDCIAPMFAPAFVYNDILGTLSLTPSADANNQLIIGTDGRPYSHYSFRVTTGATAVVPIGGIVVENGDALHFWSSTGLGFTITAGSAVVKADIVSVSADAGNTLAFGTDGKLFVPTPGAFAETPLTVTDSSTIDLTAGGTGNGHTGLTAALKVSALPNNAATAQPDGLYINQTPVQVASPLGTMTLGVSGVFNHTVSADAKISSTAGNVLTVDVNGLYVAPAAAGVQTPITAVDSTTIDLTSSGLDNHTLTASLIISADVTNDLSVLVGAQPGLYVPKETALTVTSSATINLTAGLTGNGHTGVTASAKLSATAGNSLVANPDGLFVPSSPITSCGLGTVINATANQALPQRLIGLDAGNCVVPLALTINQALFANGSNQVIQDARFFYDPVLGSFAANGTAPAPTGTSSAVIGGDNGTASGLRSVVIGGFVNTASNPSSAVLGGNNNQANGDASVVVGGFANIITNNGFGGQVILGGTTNINESQASVVYGQNNTLNAGSTSVLLGGNANILSGTNSFSFVTGVNNVVSGLGNGICVGLNNAISGNANESAVFGSTHSVTSENTGTMGEANQLNGLNSMAFGNSLRVRAAAQVAVGEMNIIPALGNATSPTSSIGSDLMFTIGNGQPSIGFRSNAMAWRKDGIEQWYIALDNNSPGNRLPQYATTAAAIAGLAVSAVAGSANLAFGALAMVDVAGVPMWFKFDGTNWLFAF